MSKPAASLEDDLANLLGHVCVKYGFCLMGEKWEHIALSPRLDAKGFANAVLVAEGFTPEYEKEWRRTLEQTFTEWFGKSAASTADYE